MSTMTVDENTDTGDPVQPVHLWINPTKIDLVAPAARGRVGTHHQPKSPPTSTVLPTLRVTDSIPMDIDHGPHCHQRAADTIQQSTGTVTFPSSRQEQDLSVQLKHLTASNARPRASSESFLSSSSNTSRHDRVIIDAIVTTTFQGDLCRMPPPPSTPATTDSGSTQVSIAFTSFPAMALTTAQSGNQASTNVINSVRPQATIENGKACISRGQTSPLPYLFGCTFPLKHGIPSKHSSTHNVEPIRFQEVFGTYLAPLWHGASEWRSQGAVLSLRQNKYTNSNEVSCH